MNPTQRRAAMTKNDRAMRRFISDRIISYILSANLSSDDTTAKFSNPETGYKHRIDRYLDDDNNDILCSILLNVTPNDILFHLYGIYHKTTSIQVLIDANYDCCALMRYDNLKLSHGNASSIEMFDSFECLFPLIPNIILGRYGRIAQGYRANPKKIDLSCDDRVIIYSHRAGRAGTHARQVSPFCFPSTHDFAINPHIIAYDLDSHRSARRITDSHHRSANAPRSGGLIRAKRLLDIHSTTSTAATGNIIMNPKIDNAGVPVIMQFYPPQDYYDQVRPSCYTSSSTSESEEESSSLGPSPCKKDNIVLDLTPAAPDSKFSVILQKAFNTAMLIIILSWICGW